MGLATIDPHSQKEHTHTLKTQVINVCVTRRPTRSGRECKGSRHQGLVPVASWGPESGVGAWTVAVETATAARPFAPSHTVE